MKKNMTSERVSFTDGYRAPDNAQAVKENNTAGINRIVKLSAVINGEIISSFKHFKLKQSAVTHHEFELILAHDALSEKQGHQLEQANAFLGKRLTIKIAYKDFETKNSPERVFVGIITKVGFSQEAHSLGNIILKGFSPTILLDGSPHTQSFGGSQPVNTGMIADEVIKQGIDPFWYDFRVNAKASSQIVYSSQYNETHYNYLCRLAEAYGEQFFYDGEVLHFGNMPAPAAPLELVSGSNTSNIHTELRAIHTQPGYYGYNSSKNTMLTSGHTPLKHMGSLAQTAYSNNEGIFKTPSLQPAPIRAATDMDVVNSQTGAWGSKGVDVFVVSGDTTMPFLYPGCTADLYLRKPDSGKTEYFTKLMMTEVTHEIDTLGHYKGSFEAIASDTGFIPKPEFTTPFAETQPAVVVSNEDPLGQGRVKVKFLWQLNETTDFIRVMSPDAGGTDQITQNRGYVAIPEVGDQVMVGFVHNHPDRPFVLGGMFHGGVALGGGVNNHLKSIQTRSGIRILMNDAEGSVNIVDPSGNNYFMDGKGNITVSAPNDINFNAGGNLNINVGQNMSTSVGMNKTDTVTMNHSESVGMIKTSSVIGDSQVFITGKLTEFIEGDVHSEVKQERNEISRKEMNFSTEENFTSHTKSSIYMNSGEKGHNH